MRPKAVQTVKSVKGGSWETIRFADCPDHFRELKPDAKGNRKKVYQRSIDYAGDTAAGWEFICKENATHTRHRFYAIPPPYVPRGWTAEEALQWFRDEIDRVSKDAEPTKSQS